jgi:hypothetical protein
MGVAAPRQSALRRASRQPAPACRQGHEAWANEISGVATAIMGGRRMSGWVRAIPEAYGNDALRQKLIEAALHFTGSLPKKEKQ